jgi:hypothetical protein
VTTRPDRVIPLRHRWCVLVSRRELADSEGDEGWRAKGIRRVAKQTTFETSQTETHGIGSARSLRLKSSSQKKPSQYCDTALMRHTFRNECTEANFGARIRYSDNVSGPLPTSTVVLPNCVHRPVHQVGISMPRDATDRPLPVSRSSSREKFLNNRAVLGSATKMREKRLRHFDENPEKAAGRDIVVRQVHREPTDHVVGSDFPWRIPI